MRWGRSQFYALLRQLMMLASSLPCETRSFPMFLQQAMQCGFPNLQRSALIGNFAKRPSRQLLGLISPKNLILLKLIAARTRDSLNVQDILFMQGQLDEAYLPHWAVKEQLEQALQESHEQA